MTYVDGFVLVVPKKKVAIYKKMAQQGRKLWKKYGALDYKECIGDDVHPNTGGMKASSFPQIAKLKKGETVWFSFIVFKSKKHRDQVNAKVMKDPLMSQEHWKDKPMPFDMKRMAYGGFKVSVE
ncbi:MAG: hypothetical protein RL557_668 [archaeon]|jgi:uncharacterized protein YbaA (DUF1428 family)